MTREDGDERIGPQRCARWCVRLVGQNEVDWLRDLHDGLAAAAGGPIERPVQI